MRYPPIGKLLLGLLFLAGFLVSCQKQLPPPPDGTGLDHGNRYHSAFTSFYATSTNTQSSHDDSKGLVVIYFYNNFLQRNDMPPRSLFANLSVEVKTGNAHLQVWELPTENPYSRDEILARIAKGPDALNATYPARSCSFPINHQLSILPNLSDETANSIYLKTVSACSKSRTIMFTRDEMSNGEWYGIRTRNGLGVVSKYDLERNGESQSTAAYDQLLNYAYTLFKANP